MMANKISHVFDFNGPSYTLDSACASSLYALAQALNDIKEGRCDSAIVGTSNLILKPSKTVQLSKLNVLSDDGACKTFDKAANGYVRAETVAVLFLQKMGDARRNYATVVHGKVNADGYKSEGITFPSSKILSKLMKEIYTEAKIDPTEVSFVEAHGTGTPVGDFEEITAITNIFCKDRKKPLLVGSVRSNFGHTEAASGLCSVVKVLLAFENGVIPANLHYKEPNPNIESLVDGRIQVVNENMPFEGGLVSINSLGLGGTNAHVVLHFNKKAKGPLDSLQKLPQIVTVSGRTNEAVETFLEKIKENGQDHEFISLVRGIHADNIKGHPFRGYEVLDSLSARETADSVMTKRPIWFIFSGMGTQWAGMGKDLLNIECFRKSIGRCANVLKREGVDLMRLIENHSDNSFRNVVNASITITAIQIGLVDVMILLGIRPDGLIGYSIGELCCGYADGSLTLEQTILMAYFRGKSISDTRKITGAMAAIGLSWEKTQEVCPLEITISCYNGPDSVTVSGPVESIDAFVKKLEQDNIFVKSVDSSGIAFHSKYVAEAAEVFRFEVEKLIATPKRRSSKWISTSILKSEWNKPLAQFSSYDYYVNNLLSPVLFHQALQHVPKSAIIIEIAPHCSLLAIIRKSLSSSSTIIGLQISNHANNASYFLANMGKLYNAGAQPQISQLYPPVKYPVSRGTAMISSAIKWDHSTKWSIPDFSSKSNLEQMYIVNVDLSSNEYEHIAGHIIDGKIVFPAAGYITLVWKMLAKKNNSFFENFPLVFKNLEFLRATVMEEGQSVDFTIIISEESNEFKIFESGALTAKGNFEINEKNFAGQLIDSCNRQVESTSYELSTDDIYNELKSRGYGYQGSFRSIHSANIEVTSALVESSNDWISLIDSLLQFGTLSINTKDILIPAKIFYLSLNPIAHKSQFTSKHIPLNYHKKTSTLKCGGVELRCVKLSAISQKPTIATPQYEKYIFVPFDNNEQLSEYPDQAKKHALTVLLQIVKENLQLLTIKMVEVTEERSHFELLTPMAIKILQTGQLTKVSLLHLALLVTATKVAAE